MTILVRIKNDTELRLSKLESNEFAVIESFNVSKDTGKGRQHYIGNNLEEATDIYNSIK